MIDIKVPAVGESISEVTLLKWMKNDGDFVQRDEVIAELESEKATFEVNAEKAGILKQGGVKEGDTIKIGDILASIDESAVQPAAGSEQQAIGNQQPAIPEKKASSNGKEKKDVKEPQTSNIKATPVAKEIISDKHVDPKSVTPTGFQGKILKEDVLAALSSPGKKGFNGN